ncbi:hypothetical protein [Campylobacter blaseri]|uniref:hypothetical protein n=1 Tax=Campylobacter blaseri TaxID=2042961 RepID=UPI001056E52F|nr:hypothetical protein [Campylobacter blaseri]
MNKVDEIFKNIRWKKIETTYKDECKTDNHSINFGKHIRNAVSHLRCYYEFIDNERCVTFKDDTMTDKTQKCSLQCKTADIGNSISELQKALMLFLNK